MAITPRRRKAKIVKVEPDRLQVTGTNISDIFSSKRFHDIERTMFGSRPPARPPYIINSITDFYLENADDNVRTDK